jgi:hypothetical protein
LNVKRAILVTVLIIMLAAMVATPAIATPPEDKKVPVEVTFQITSRTIIENITTNGNISHIIIEMKWAVNIIIDDSITPITGTADVYRITDYRYKKQGGVDQIINDDIVFSFPTEEAGFEGYAHSMITDYTSPPVTYNIDVHVLLHGTGEFEGQTLNAWQSGPGTTALWEGYLLKP